MDGEQAERVLQMVRVLGSLLVTKLLSNVEKMKTKKINYDEDSSCMMEQVE